MDADVPALEAADRALALNVMQRWAAAHPEADTPRWLSAEGELVTPRRLIAGMETGDAIGEFWFACLAFARTGRAPVGFDEVIDAHRGQAVLWEASRRTL